MNIFEAATCAFDFAMMTTDQEIFKKHQSSSYFIKNIHFLKKKKLFLKKLVLLHC